MLTVALMKLPGRIRLSAMGTYILYFLFLLFPVGNSDCVDSVAFMLCASIASSGGCIDSPQFMLVYCKKSCGVCSPETPTQSVKTQQQATSPTTTMTSLASTTPPTTMASLATTTPPTTMASLATTTPPTTMASLATTSPPLTTETATHTLRATTIASQAHKTTRESETTPKTTQSPAELTTAASTTNKQPTSTTPIMTQSQAKTTTAVSTTKQHNCRKPLLTFNTSDPDILQMQIRSAIESLKAELKVNKTSLSSTIRSLTSASDDRPSSAAIGWFGTLLLGLLFGTIILADAVKFVAYIVS